MILQRGDRGSYVRALQSALLEAGHNPGEIDGIFGRITREAVRSYQRAVGLNVTGIAGVSTLRKLRGEGPLSADDHRSARVFLASVGQGASELVTPLAALLVRARSGDMPNDANLAVAWVARYIHDLGVSEASANRGPLVDPLIALGGGNPNTRPSWCSYFVAAVRRIVAWLRGELGMPPIAYARSGGAIRAYHKASESQRVRIGVAYDAMNSGGAGVLTGLAYHRIRTAAPINSVYAARDGAAAPGHTGIVIDVEPDGSLLCVGGNSSGAGHSQSSRGGRVALEVISTDPSNKPAHAAMMRLVGFTRVEVTE